MEEDTGAYADIRKICVVELAAVGSWSRIARILGPRSLCVSLEALAHAFAASGLRMRPTPAFVWLDS